MSLASKFMSSSFQKLCAVTRYAIAKELTHRAYHDPQSSLPPKSRRHLNIVKDRQIRRCLDESINPRCSPYPPRTQDRKLYRFEFDHPAGERQRWIDRKRSLDTRDERDPEIKRI